MTFECEHLNAIRLQPRYRITVCGVTQTICTDCRALLLRQLQDQEPR